MSWNYRDNFAGQMLESGDATSIGVGFTPVGLLADFYTAGTGEDYFTGEEVSGWMRAAVVLPFVSELRKGGRVAGAVGELRRSGLKDAHHTIQDASVRDVPGYTSNAAPGVHLPGPANTPGTPHYIATQVQRQAGGGTYAAERRIGYKALRRAGLSQDEARSAIQRADAYFESLNVRPDTVTRIPGNR